MTLRRQVKRIGGSLGVLIPRDFAEAMDVKDGSPVRLTLVGRQVVIEPEDDLLDDASVRRAYGAVLRRHAGAFERLAAEQLGPSRRKRAAPQRRGGRQRAPSSRRPRTRRS